MTRWEFQVMVMLNEGLADPQGKAIEEALPAMGFTDVSDVRAGKHFHLTVEAPTHEEAQERAGEIAQRVLSNPVIESYWLTSVVSGESE